MVTLLFRRDLIREIYRSTTNKIGNQYNLKQKKSQRREWANITFSFECYRFHKSTLQFPKQKKYSDRFKIPNNTRQFKKVENNLRNIDVSSPESVG